MEQTIKKMNAMKLFGMRDALSEQVELAAYDELSFEERIGMLVDREWIYRENRGLDASLMRSLADCR